MVISKQLGVFLNFVHNRFKLTVNDTLQAAGFNITAEQFLLLDTLWTEGPQPQQAIADIMLKDKNSVVKLVDTLEAHKLVRRSSNPLDKRQNIVQLTTKGKAIQQPVTEAAQAAIDTITKGLTQEEISTLLSMLNTMARNMDSEVDLLEIARKFPIHKPQ